MLLSVIATIINLVTARILLYYGRKHNSITLEADSHHLMTDVWTTVGIIVGIFSKVDELANIRPTHAIAVSISILYTGGKLIFALRWSNGYKAYRKRINSYQRNIRPL